MSTSTTTAPDPRQSSAADRLPAGAGPNGWLAFAAVLLFINGFLASFWGVAAITSEDVITVGGSGDVTIWSFDAWGWIQLTLGVLMVLVSVGLFLGKGAARWAAVLFVTVHALAQFGSLAAFPLWSITVLAIDLVILYNLLVRWQLEEL